MRFSRKINPDSKPNANFITKKRLREDEINFEKLREDNSKLWFGVLSEDINAIEGMQSGRSSPSYNGGNFSPVMDNPTHHFHKWVVTNIV